MRIYRIYIDGIAQGLGFTNYTQAKRNLVELQTNNPLDKNIIKIIKEE